MDLADSWSQFLDVNHAVCHACTRVLCPVDVQLDVGAEYICDLEHNIWTDGR